MRTKINIPEIAELRSDVEKTFGSTILTPRNFTALSDAIMAKLQEYISETTLQRLWLYKPGYVTVATHTLDILSRYLGHRDWTSYCESLHSSSREESEMFSGPVINVRDLNVGTLVRITWQPDRECVIKYLGNYRFEAVETHNSKLSKGDTFSCMQIQEGRELVLDHLVRESTDMRYVIGSKNGLTSAVVL